MKASHLVRLLLLSLIPGTLAGCDEPIGPADSTQYVAENDLLFIRTAEDAPPLADTVVSFWAVRGENREVEIRYLPTYNSEGGKCLVFRVPANGLLRDPEGQSFEEGDSVQITIRVVDVDRFIFEFEPSGLQFDPDHPAELEVSYRWADRDYNGDGVVDGEDERIEDELGFWRQENPGEPWFQTATAKAGDIEEVNADITGFTRYAVASN